MYVGVPRGARCRKLDVGVEAGVELLVFRGGGTAGMGLGRSVGGPTRQVPVVPMSRTDERRLCVRPLVAMSRGNRETDCGELGACTNRSHELWE